MRTLRHWYRLLLLTLCVLLPEAMHAAGGTDIQFMAKELIIRFAPLWIIVGVLVLVIAGFTLMISQDEGSIDKAKKTIIAVVFGGILTTIILVMDPLNFVRLVYNPFFGIGYGFVVPTAGAGTIGLEAVGLSQWLSMIAVMMGVLFIIIAVLKAVVRFGDETAYAAVRTALLHVIVGVVLIAGAFLVQLAFFGSASGPGQVVEGSLNIEPNPLIGLISEKLFIILNVILLIAVGVLIYAGLRMIISLGREEDFTAAKSLAIRVVIGIIVILISYSVVFIVASIFT